MSQIKAYIFLICIFTSLLPAQTFEVRSITGNAKVQKPDKRDWEKISSGSKLSDNDLVETFFQTRLILTFGNNQVILGSNSRVLLNISTTNQQDSLLNVNLTLFGGAIYTKTVSGCHTVIYTANAVCEMDSGSVSTVADIKTGETGFHSLSGPVYVRNIAHQKGIELHPGMTTMVLPSKEPAVPLYITHRHAALLKSLFGDEYIENEMEAMKIEPTEDYGSGSHLTPSQTLSPESNKPSDQEMSKNQFSLDRIYGIILESQKSETRFYAPLQRPVYAALNKLILSTGADIGFYDGKRYPAFSIQPSLNLPVFSLGLRLRFAEDYRDRINYGFKSRAGLLDKLEHILIGKDSTYIYAGSIRNYTLGHGLIVNDFTNEDPREIFHPIGVKGQVQFSEIGIKAFLSDVTNPQIGGIYFSMEPSMYSLGLGYYFDLNQHKNRDNSGNFRYFKQPSSGTTLIPDPQEDISNAHIYEFDFSSDIISNHKMKLRLSFELAQKLQPQNDGLILRMPTVYCSFNRTGLGLSFIGETGRLMSHQFDSHYLLNRYRIKSASTSDTLITQNNYLSNDRRAMGFQMSFNSNPFKGIDIDFKYRQDFLGKHQIRLIQTDSTGDSSIDVSGDFSYKLMCRFNNELIPFLKYGDLYIQQFHGKTLPAGGKLIYSWGTEFGGYLLTKPLFLNTAVEAGVKALFMDNIDNLNNAAEPEDMLWEFYAGLQIGFL